MAIGNSKIKTKKTRLSKSKVKEQEDKKPNFYLGDSSRAKLSNVKPELVGVVRRAIEITEQDFSVIEGVRTLARQKELLAKGATQTLNSRHLTGHAVDLAPYPLDWNDWDKFYHIADAMKQAAIELDVKIEWGSAWHLKPFNDGENDAKSSKQEYIDLRKSQNRKPFCDGPHFQLPEDFD